MIADLINSLTGRPLPGNPDGFDYETSSLESTSISLPENDTPQDADNQEDGPEYDPNLYTVETRNEEDGSWTVETFEVPSDPYEDMPVSSPTPEPENVVQPEAEISPEGGLDYATIDFGLDSQGVPIVPGEPESTSISLPENDTSQDADNQEDEPEYDPNLYTVETRNEEDGSWTVETFEVPSEDNSYDYTYEEPVSSLSPEPENVVQPEVAISINDMDAYDAYMNSVDFF